MRNPEFSARDSNIDRNAEIERRVDALFDWSDKIAHDAMRRIVEAIRPSAEQPYVVVVSPDAGQQG